MLPSHRLWVLIGLCSLSSCTEQTAPPAAVDQSIARDFGPADLRQTAEFLPDQGSVRPSTECTQYLGCVVAATPDQAAAEQTKYGALSACWDQPADASACSAACDSAYQALAKTYTKLAACGGCDPSLDPSCSIVGIPCASDSECTTKRCLTYVDYVQVAPKGGYCTETCTIGAASCPEGSACGGMPTRAGIFDPTQHPSYCYRRCDPKKKDSCRSGYQCLPLSLDLQGTTGPTACLPEKKA